MNGTIGFTTPTMSEEDFKALALRTVTKALVLLKKSLNIDCKLEEYSVSKPALPSKFGALRFECKFKFPKDFFLASFDEYQFTDIDMAYKAFPDATGLMPEGEWELLKTKLPKEEFLALCIAGRLYKSAKYFG